MCLPLVTMHLVDGFTGKESKMVEKNLHAYLLNYTSPQIRPAVNENDPVLVKFGFRLQQIVNLEEPEQRIQMKIWLKMSWKNNMMRWNLD